MLNCSLADKINLPEKTLSLPSRWQFNVVLLPNKSSTRGKKRKRVRERIQSKRGKRLPPQFQVADPSVPMGIHPAMLPYPDDTGSNTGQVKGGNRNNQQEPLQSFRRGEFDMMAWLHRHPGQDRALLHDSADNYVDDAFTRFWQATTRKQALDFQVSSAMFMKSIACIVMLTNG